MASRAIFRGRSFVSRYQTISCRGFRATRRDDENEEELARNEKDLESRKRDKLLEISRAFKGFASAPSSSRDRLEFIHLVNKEIEDYNRMIDKVEKMDLLKTIDDIELIPELTVLPGEAKLDLHPKDRKDDSISIFDRATQALVISGMVDLCSKVIFSILAAVREGPRKTIDSLVSQQDPVPLTSEHLQEIRDKLREQSSMLRELLGKTPQGVPPPSRSSPSGPSSLSSGSSPSSSGSPSPPSGSSPSSPGPSPLPSQPTLSSGPSPSSHDSDYPDPPDFPDIL